MKENTLTWLYQEQKRLDIFIRGKNEGKGGLDVACLVE